MCNVSHSFKFCTCAKEDKGPGAPGSKLPEYTWWLSRFTGPDDSGIMGSIVGPSSDLGEGLTVAAVIDVLHSGHGFDFPYFPAENDSLRISISGKDKGYRYMSFLYQKGNWTEGMNAPFTTRSEELAKGNVFKGNDPKKGTAL
jgi:hypothetical protein